MSLLKNRERLLPGHPGFSWALSPPRLAGFVATVEPGAVVQRHRPLMILAIGQMIVILTKCIDLSVAANLALTGMVSALLNGMGVPLIIILPAAILLVLP